MNGTYWVSTHSDGVGWLAGNSWVRGCLGSKGVVRRGVIDTMRGGCDDDAIGGDGCGDSGNGALVGSGDSFIRIGGSYCSIDEYSRRCCPQGTRGSGGISTWGGSTGIGVGMDKGTNGDGFTRGGNDVMVGADSGAFGIVMTVGPPPEGPGAGMKTGDGDLLLVILLRLWRNV